MEEAFLTQFSLRRGAAVYTIYIPASVFGVSALDIRLIFCDIVHQCWAAKHIVIYSMDM